MSTMSAPSATAWLAASRAAPNSLVAPRSKNESGVRLITAMIPNEPWSQLPAAQPQRPVAAVGPGVSHRQEAIAPAWFGKNLYVRFLNGTAPEHDLTYSDVFMVPSRSASARGWTWTWPPRTAAAPPSRIVTANMTAVSGRRMAETVARRGGLAILPQDIPADVVADVIAWVKSRDLVVETALTLAPTDTAGDALSLLPKRAHNAVVVVEDGPPGRRGHRGRLPGRGPVHPAEPRDVGRPVHAARRDPARAGVLAAARGPAPAGARGGRLGPLPGHHDPDRGAARDALLPRRGRLGPAAGRRRPRRERRRGGQGQAAARRGRRRAGGGHRARAPGEDDLRAEGGARPGARGPAGGGQRGHRGRGGRPGGGRGGHRQGRRGARARCARPG